MSQRTLHVARTSPVVSGWPSHLNTANIQTQARRCYARPKTKCGARHHGNEIKARCDSRGECAESADALAYNFASVQVQICLSGQFSQVWYSFANCGCGDTVCTCRYSDLMRVGVADGRVLQNGCDSICSVSWEFNSQQHVAHMPTAHHPLRWSADEQCGSGRSCTRALGPRRPVIVQSEGRITHLSWALKRGSASNSANAESDTATNTVCSSGLDALPPPHHHGIPANALAL